jgi:hypothetical protein
MEIEVLVPVPATGVEQRPLARRLEQRGDRTIGFVDNQKHNAGLLLRHVAEELHRLAGPFAEMHEAKVATTAAPAAVMGRLQRCHAVVLAIAD